MGDIYFTILCIAVFAMFVTWWNERTKVRRLQEDLDQISAACEPADAHPSSATHAASDVQASADAQSSGDDASSVDINTRELFLDVLTKIGCQYTIGNKATQDDEGSDSDGNDVKASDTDDDGIFFAFQGEHFLAYAENGRAYVSLWDTYWMQVDLHDIDEVCRLRKAINTSNIGTSVTSVFTIDEAEAKMIVHCKSIILFVSTIPNIERYLEAELTNFFHAHKAIEREMDKLRDSASGSRGNAQ